MASTITSSADALAVIQRKSLGRILDAGKHKVVGVGGKECLSVRSLTNEASRTAHRIDHGRERDPAATTQRMISTYITARGGSECARGGAMIILHS